MTLTTRGWFAILIAIILGILIAAMVLRHFDYYPEQPVRVCDSAAGCYWTTPSAEPSPSG